MMTATLPKLPSHSPKRSDNTPLLEINKRFALQSRTPETDWNALEPFMHDHHATPPLLDLPTQVGVTTHVNDVKGIDEKNGTYINPFRLSLLKHIKLDKKIIRAKGHYLFDANDNKYLDFLAQYGAVPFGYNPAFLWNNIQSSFFTDAPSLIQPFISIAAERLAQQLTALYPADMRYTTFSNSGAESVEVALKIARAKTQRKTILSVKNGFHGKTLGALSATGNPHYQDPFLVDTTHFETVSLNDQAELEQRLSPKDVAAFIIEVVQGEAGMIPAESEYLVKAQELCKRFGTLLILDEVQTGLGRTGKLFAAEHFGIQPDIVCLSKALGGGLVAIGATLCTRQAWTDEFGQFHSSTFANNHLACSIASGVLDKLVENDSHLIREIEKKGTYLRDRLEKLTQEFPGVFARVTGMGLMQGLHLSPWSDNKGYFPMFASSVGDAVPLVCGYLMNEHHIITMPGFNQRNVLRIEPPLTIKYEEIDQLITALRNVGHLIHGDNFYGLVRYLISDNKVGHANAVSRAIDPSESPQRETKPGRDGKGVLQDPGPMDEPITAPATFGIRDAAHEFQNVAAVEKRIRRLWAVLCDLKAGRAIKVSTGDYDLLVEVVSEDFDSKVKHLDGPVHGTFVSRLTQIRDWIGVEEFGAFRGRLDARRGHCPLDVLQKNAGHSPKGHTINQDNKDEKSHPWRIIMQA